MNHQLWNSVGARVLALTFVLAGLAACGDRISNTDSGAAPKAAAASPSAIVIGTAPGQPTADAPGAPPVASNTTEVTKSVESVSMPQPGQANDHSNLASKPSQKAEEIATTPAEGAKANSGERTR